MRVLLLLAAGCLPAWAQPEEPPAAEQPAAVSSAPAAQTAVSSTAPAAILPEAPPRPRSNVVVHKEAADWEPISVVLRPDLPAAKSSFERRLRKAGKGYKGESSAARAAARVHPAGEDRWLVISVYPEALRRQRLHLEARLLIQEGYLEGVKLAAVRVTGKTDSDEDSFTLRAKGIDFVERFPGSGEVELAAVNAGPKRALNAGRARFAAFGGSDLGFVNFSWRCPAFTYFTNPPDGKKSGPKDAVRSGG
ncbi:MAG: hypothetical protein PHF00_09410 [Elusimicrobia bacterium]|nr:hypothetical protein [Elusimicrobiota bacterium]